MYVVAACPSSIRAVSGAEISAPAGQRFGRAEGPMDVTDRISETLVRLPMFFDLGSEIEAVIDIAQEVLTEIGVAS